MQYNRYGSSTWYKLTDNPFLNCMSEPYNTYPARESCDMELGEPDPWTGHTIIGDAYTNNHVGFIKAYTIDVP